MNKDKFPKSVRGFYWLVIKKFPFAIGTIFLCRLLGNAFDMLVRPLTSKWMIEIFQNAAHSDFSAVFGLICMLGGFYSVGIIGTFVESLISGHINQIFNRYKLYVLYKRIYSNDIAFFLDKPSGQIISQASAISMKLHALMDGFWGRFLGISLGFLLIVGTMFAMNIWFVIVLLTYGVVKLIWEWKLQKKIKANSTLEMEEGAIYDGLRSDSLNNALVVKYFANTEYENQYIYHGRDRLIEIIKHGYFLSRCRWLPTSILWLCVRVFMLVLCFFLIKNGSLSLSNAVFVITSAASINNAFSQLNKELQTYSKNLAQATKAYSIVIADRKIVDKPNAKNINVKHSKIEFKDVDFGYGENTVFKKFNLTINDGEKVGIVGLSGAGKTTLCHLLLRMYDVNGGAIMLNDKDIRDVKHESLLRAISFVPQETTLFNRSIYENIKYAKPTSNKNQIIKAAEKANIHKFILSLDKGYETQVGNNGVKLSGGQRQRVSIARALLKDAPILILDEATSALDSKNELMIQKSLKNVMKGKTALVIAHRLSTLRNMDRIVVIRNGKVVESGTHKQLLRKKGEYRKLWDMQTMGFVE